MHWLKWLTKDPSSDISRDIVGALFYITQLRHLVCFCPGKRIYTAKLKFSTDFNMMPHFE